MDADLDADADVGTDADADERQGHAPSETATVFLGWSAWSYFDASHGGARSEGQERDSVLRAGRQELATLNSMDRTRVDADLRAWENATTGSLRDQLHRDAAANRQKIAQTGTSAAGSVLAAAVTRLDTGTGDAVMIASVQVKLTTAQGAETYQRKRYEVGLARTSGGWKLKSLTAIPAGDR
jgi:Mce-associated membrane protein